MNGEIIKHATLAARPVGSKGAAATPLSSIGGLPIAGATAMGGAGGPRRSAVEAAATDKPRRLRQNKEERRIEKRMEIMSGIDDMLDDKPSKKKVRLYLLTRIQQLLMEKGITTADH